MVPGDGMEKITLKDGVKKRGRSSSERNATRGSAFCPSLVRMLSLGGKASLPFCSLSVLRFPVSPRPQREGNSSERGREPSFSPLGTGDNLL